MAGYSACALRLACRPGAKCRHTFSPATALFMSTSSSRPSSSPSSSSKHAPRFFKGQKRSDVKEVKKEVDEPVPDRPFTLPPGEFRPKQSLGQNYLSDQNYVTKIVDAFRAQHENKMLERHKQTAASTKQSTEASEEQMEEKLGKRVLEIGPGTGALSRSLHPIYPKMNAIEIDQRAIAFLNEKLPRFRVMRYDVLQFDWRRYAEDVGGPVSIIANLPYYIVSQVLFSLADAYEHVELAVVTMQWEVATRICAKPRTKDYGIPSVVFQLYAESRMVLKIPPNVFYPVPKVDSALLSVDFTKQHPELKTVFPEQLRKVVTTSFRQRRKMLRQSLKDLIATEELFLPETWATKRPEEISPGEFLALTREMYKGKLPADLPDHVREAVPQKAVIPPDGANADEISTRYLRNQKADVWRGLLSQM
eukprot:scaffold192_cov320-Ochromonas_danica.AAC.5